MRPVLLSLALVLVFVPSCHAQSLKDGHIVGDTYRNDFLHYSYTWPKFLQPVDVSTLLIHAPTPLQDEFMLFAAQQGSEPFGILVLSEKLHTPSPKNPHGFQDGADFLSRLPKSSEIKILKDQRTLTKEGLPVVEIDYLNGREYDSGMTVQVGEYLVVFKCNAKSASDLALMTQSILASGRFK